MAIDLFQSRRTYNYKCLWWSRKENDEINNDELIMRRTPSGFFYAKEVNAEENSNIVYGNSFMVNKTMVSIKSPDYLGNIKANDIVNYKGEKWIVDNVQKKQSRISNSEFLINEKLSHFWFLQLRK